MKTQERAASAFFAMGLPSISTSSMIAKQDNGPRRMERVSKMNDLVCGDLVGGGDSLKP